MIKKFFRDSKIHKKVVSNIFFDYLFLLRPTLFFGVWVMIVVGMYLADLSNGLITLWNFNFSLNTILLFIGITLICSSTFVINQIVDRKSDKINKKLLIVDDKISIKSAEKVYPSLAISGFIFVLIGDWKIFPFAFFIFILWGIIYNKTPFAWKKKPFLGVLVNSSVGIVLLLIGCLHSSLDNVELTKVSILCLPYIFSFTAVSIMTNIPDFLGDKDVKATTLAVKFGKRFSVFIASLLVVLAFLLSYKLDDPVICTSTAVSIPFFMFALLRNLEKDFLRAIRYPIFLLNVFVMVVYPLLLPIVLVVYYLSKYYYWHRFNLHYPTFLVEND